MTEPFNVALCVVMFVAAIVTGVGPVTAGVVKLRDEAVTAVPLAGVAFTQK